ncbi:MAG: DNA polymerase III subunit gamma/tau [Planctomycetes bacterium]|nr:DNA polymerase III subunit gamma/tau [Planctomycetota bacterium]
MAYLVLARKYRPQSFAEVVGQEEIGRTLERAIRQDRVGHAYLFTGPRGVGKTSMARIFAKALNCPECGAPGTPGSGRSCNRCAVCADIARGADVDVIEIDGASNRGIDEVRGVREGAKYLPARVRFKIYIIDEVHMLTGPAFNALLKTLEEPPPHVIFVFATTHPQALPDTVRSRCQRYDFRPIGAPEIVRRLGQISEAEGAAAEPEALELIAALADGSMRDAQSLLDQMIAYGEGKVERAAVERMLGLAPGALCLDLLQALARGEGGAALALADRVLQGGGSAEDLADRLERIARDLLVLATVGDTTDVHLLAGVGAATLRPLARELFDPEALAYLVRLFLEARGAMRPPGPPRIALELALIRAAALRDFLPLKEVIAAVHRLAEAAPAHAAPPPAGRRPAPAVPPPGSRPAAEAAGNEDPEPGGGRGAAPAPTPTIRDVEAQWPAVIQGVIRSRPSLGSLLARSRCARLEGDCLTVELPGRNRFGQERLSQADNLRTIQDILLQLTGRSLTLSIVLADPAAPPPADQESAARAAPTSLEDGVRRALDIFDGGEVPPGGDDVP